VKKVFDFIKRYYKNIIIILLISIVIIYASIHILIKKGVIDFNNIRNVNSQDSSENENNSNNVENEINKIIGMNVNEVADFIDSINPSLILDNNYNVILTEDDSLNGIVKDYSIVEEMDYRVPIQKVYLDVYFREYSLEEKKKVIEDIQYRMREKKIIDSSNITEAEAIDLCLKYNINYGSLGGSYISKINVKNIYDEKKEKNTLVTAIDINTFDLNTIQRLKDGIICSLVIVDSETGEKVDEYNENASVNMCSYQIKDEEYEKIYNYLQNREQIIPDSEINNNNENNEDNLPIALNTRYMTYENYVYWRTNNMYNDITNKSIYFTSNNKVIADDYRIGVDYLIGTYTIDNDIITIKFNEIIYNELADESTQEVYSTTPTVTFKIVDKNTIVYQNTQIHRSVGDKDTYTYSIN
jgi:hypothetical protein